MTNTDSYPRDPTTITAGEPIPADRLAAIFDAIDAGRALTEAR